MNKKLKILYVSDLFSGLKPVFVEGKDSPEGSPAFFEPLKKLLESGNHVDFIFPIFEKNNMKINASRFLQESRIWLYYYRKDIILRPFIVIKLLIFLIKLLKKGKYDFIYCHGSFGVYGNIAANILKIPVGHRIYGSFLYYRLKEKSKLYLAYRYYRQYLPFIIPKKFILMTNDGTQGDKLFELIGRKKCCNFYFELNGVDKSREVMFATKQYNSKIILLYPARIDLWKNQEYAIDVLSELKEIRRLDNIELHFVGTINNDKYFKSLKEKAENYGVINSITFHGSLSKERLVEFYEKSFAVFSFYNFSNLGNVTIEALTMGCLLVSLKDGSLDGIVKHGENAILIDSPKEGAIWIDKLISENAYYNQLRENAFAQSNKTFRTWEERSDFEIELIHKAIE